MSKISVILKIYVTFSRLLCQLVKFCICAEFLDTKLSEINSQILRLPKVFLLKHTNE